MIYRPEHPKPQFMRDSWHNLNGEWQFELDAGNSGVARELFRPDMRYTMKITVPFCPESKLSGIENVDFMSSVWYKRDFELNNENLKNRVVIHFGAVDYFATVYVNGKRCGTHKGGYVSFSFDITDYVNPGKNTVTVNAVDNTRDRLIPSGKQASGYFSSGCFYTRTTGIWQTVWLEFLPETHIISAKYHANAQDAILTVNAKLCGKGVFTAEAFYNGVSVGKASTFSNGEDALLTLRLSEKHLWEVGEGNLYDLTLTYGEDTVKSYFGLRSVHIEGHKFMINGKSVFQRLILDQGFYPDGIYTAPSDSELIVDIERSKAMGFNGARLHEKVFEERFLYHCDRLGYIVWGEFPNWGLDHSYADSIYGILPEWLEEIDRDFNHPSIIGWCPFNETWDRYGRKQFDDLLSVVYKATKAVDSTRPCIDTSGNFHVMTDVYDLHDYEQDPVKFMEHYKELGASNKLDFYNAFESRQTYDGKKPFFVSEYGGIGFYGVSPKNKTEFLTRLKGLTEVLLNNKYIFGLCYTQLTDVEQEQNGLYYYDRTPKFDCDKFKAILSKKAAIED